MWRMVLTLIHLHSLSLVSYISSNNKPVLQCLLNITNKYFGLIPQELP